MLTTYVSGLPINAKSILSDCLTQSFGEGVVAIEELGKDMLKTKVRLSLRNPNIILVILDSVSTDMCSGIENGLFSSDKFFSYTNISDFVVFLNNKYGLSLEVPIDEEKEIAITETDLFESESDSAVVEELEKQLDKERFLVKNLKIRVADLQKQIDEGQYCQTQEDSEEEEKLRQEVIDLRSELLSVKSENRTLVDENSALKEKSSKESESSEVISSNYNSAVKELTELRTKYTLQSSLLEGKDKKIKEVQERVTYLEGELSSKKEEYERVSLALAENTSMVSKLQLDISNKDRELLRYLKELTTLKENQVSTDSLRQAQDTIASLQEELKDVSSENVDLQKELSDRDRRIKEQEDAISSLSEDIDKERNKSADLEKRIEEDNISIAQLNKNALELQSQLELKDKVGNPDEFSEEYVRLRRELAELKDGVFGKIASLSLPSNSQRVNLIPAWATGVKLSNVRFIFAGSTESRKGAYRCLLNDLRNANPKVNYLIVDLVSETSIDYVFEIKKVVPGLDWFRKGGSVQSYLSKTVLKNVDVLSTGLRYINDSYFLCIDWAKRLQELEESGYQVMLFCGDISNLVGRILHETFAGLGISVIYIHGNAVGARSLVTNLRGITNADKSLIGYFDFSPSVKRFYDVISQTNKCKIINTVKR